MISASSSRDLALEPRLAARQQVHPLLQPDILHKVFSYLAPVPDLCQANQVCTTWATVASNPRSWRRVSIYDSTLHLGATPYQTLRSSLKSFPESLISRETRAAKRARLSRSPLRQQHARGAKKAVQVISKRAGRFLQTLHLANFCQQVSDQNYLVGDEELLDLAERCGSSLHQFSVINSRAKVTAWNCFAICCNKLKVLHIIDCPTLRVKHISCIIDFLPHLEDLSLRKCSQLGGNAFQTQLQAVRRTIKRIDISMTDISLISFRDLALGFPRLEHFIANNCHSLVISGRPFRHPHLMYDIFPSLVSLQLNYVGHFSQGWVTFLSNYCPNLTALGASVFDHQPLQSLFNTHAPPIEHLSLSGREVDDHLWQIIFDKVGSTLVNCDLSRTKTTGALTVQEDQQFVALESLNLSDTRATDEHVRKIISIAPRLKHLSLTRCRGVKDRAFRRNPLHSTPPHSEQRLATKR